MTREEYLKYGVETGLLKFWEYLKLTRPLKLPEGLDEVAEKHIQSVVDAAGHPGWDWETQDITDAFIAGAEWQKAKMMDEWLKDRDGCFWDGVKEGKKAMEKQMMENAVDGRYMKADGKAYVESWLLDIDPDSVKAGDEVKIIVIPEENLNTTQNEN